jgi:Fur family transcriptional regulator, zinc uptake regulator
MNNLLIKIEKLCNSREVKLTPLRSDILKIILDSKKSLGAYDILRKLRENRPKAEPPTVYRVLDYLIEHQVIHRIHSNNTYFCCPNIDDCNTQHQAQIFICKQCGHCQEIMDKSLIQSLKKFSTKHQFQMSTQPIEIYGLCKNCLH